MPIGLPKGVYVLTGKLALDTSRGKGKTSTAVHEPAANAQAGTGGKNQPAIAQNNGGQKPPTTAAKPDAATNAGPVTSQGASNNNYKVDLKIHEGAQGKHIPNHKNFIAGKSSINENISPQILLDGFHSGKHPIVGTGARGQPIVDFGMIIGKDSASGLQTRFGTIHSGKNGAHIVPTNPNVINRRR